MSDTKRFEGEISAVGAPELDYLREKVARGLQARGMTTEWGATTTDLGAFENKEIAAFVFSLVVGLASNVAASAIYDAIKADRPAAMMTTDQDGKCTITSGKSVVRIAPAPNVPAKAP